MYQKCINSRNFQMTIPERRSVVGNDDHFSLALSKCFQSLPVSENIFSRFHHQGKPGIDVLNALFLQIYGIQKYIWHTKCTFVALTCLSTRITANLKKKYEHNWRHSLNKKISLWDLPTPHPQTHTYPPPTLFRKKTLPFSFEVPLCYLMTTYTFK